MAAYSLELIGMLVARGLLIFLAFRGFTLLVAGKRSGHTSFPAALKLRTSRQSTSETR